MDESRIGTTPISEEAPAGSDIRYEASFEELQAEIDKLGLPSASGGIDWQRVSDLSTTILTKESKDLLVASYYGVAQLYVNKESGLTNGVELFCGLLTTFWDTMYPKKKRMRGRVAAVDWWVEKSATALELLNLQSITEPDKTALVSGCEQLKQLLQDLFPDPPSITVLSRIINELPVAFTKEEKEPEKQAQEEKSAKEPQKEVPSEKRTPQNTPPPSPPPEPVVQHATGSADEAIKAIQAYNQHIIRAALSLIEQDPANPLGHRSLLSAVWSDLDTLPQATDGKTIIPAPEPYIASSLQDLAARGDWTNLVNAAANHFPQYIFWLDIHYFTAMGLEHLGLPYQKAWEAVCQETAIFHQRMPTITNLEFADGTPFASKECKEWCQGLGNDGQAMELTPAPNTDQPSSADAQHINETMVQANTLLKERKLKEAVTLLQQEMQTARSTKESMQWRLVLIQILMAGKKADIALAHCEELARDVEKHRLDQWDPVQSLLVYKTSYLCLKKGSTKLFKEQGGQLLSKIATIDPAEALRISS